MNKRILIIGHRGARGLEPENTLRSYRRALEIGVDIIECDVHLTKDRRIVLIHDHTVDRTTNGQGLVSDFTFDEIRKLDAGQGEQIPTLEELIRLAAGKAGLHIELKDPNALEPTLALVNEMGVRDEVFLTTGDIETLKRLRALDPAISVEHIFGSPPADAIERAKSVDAGRISAHIDSITQEFVDAAHEAGLEVIAWPPNTSEDQRRAAALGVDLICTDRPDILKETLAALQAEGS